MNAPSQTPGAPLDEVALRREALECAEAHGDDPEAATWLDVAAGERDVEALAAEGRTAAEIEAARELLAPLDPAVEAGLVERMVAQQVAGGAAAERAEPPESATVVWARRRRWWFALPLAVAAAVLLVFNFVGSESSPSLDGEVRVATATRGDEAGDGRAPVVRPLAWFYLDCGPTLPSRDMLGVYAESVDGKPAGLLRAGPPTPTSNGHWHVQADLSPGRWEIGCNVFDRSLGRALRLRRAPLEVAR